MYRNRKPKSKRPAPTHITSTPVSPVPAAAVIEDTETDDDDNTLARKRKSSETSRSKLSTAVKATSKRVCKNSEDADLFDMSFNASTIAPESPHKTISHSIASTSKPEQSASKASLRGRPVVESPVKSRAPAKTVASKLNANAAKPNSVVESTVKSRAPAKAVASKPNTSTAKSNTSPSKLGFVRMLSKCGFRLRGEGNSNFLGKDQAGFVQLLETQLKKDPTFPANVDKFLEEFKEYIQESLNNLSQVMENTKSDDDLSRRKSVQESLLRLLLNVDCVQPKLWKILFDVLEDLISDEDDDEKSFALVHRMMRQMRCQDRISQGDVNICDKLLSFVMLSNNNETQRELILLLPDLIQDDDHEKAAAQLSDNLTANQALIPARLDTLASLRLSDDLRSAVLDKVAAIVDKADTLYFQVILKFLVSQAEDMEPVVQGIRRHVDLDPTAAYNDGNEGLILATTLKECEKPRKLIETWVESVDRSEGKEWSSVDLIAMLVFYSFRLDRVKSLVVAAFKTQARRGHHAETDVEKAYPAVQGVVQSYYLESLLEIVGALFKSTSLEESHYASFWYCLLFRHIQLYHVRERVLDQVLIHVGQGNPCQVSLAMRTLTDAAHQNRDQMTHHANRIMTLMYDIESWELTQVRQLMDLMFWLHYGPEADRNVLQGDPDQIMIGVKKFLNHSSYAWRSKGIVGIVCAIKHMPDQRAIDEYVKLLDLQDGFSAEAVGLLYDELAFASEDLSAEVGDKVREETLRSFEDLFVKDVTPDMDGSLRYKLLVDDVQICVPLTADHGGCGGNLPTMCPQLRLGHRLVKLTDDMVDIAALLAAPVLLPTVDPDSFPLLGPREQAEVMDSLFHCVNLFRELINGFCSFKDYTLMVISRLEQIIQLDNTIAGYLPIVGDYTPPQCQFYRVVKPPAVRKPKAKGKGKKAGEKGKGKGKGKGKKDSRRTSNDSLNGSGKDGGDDSDSFAPDAGAQPAAAARTADLALYSGFFRELEMTVFVLLKQPVTFELDRPDPVEYHPDAAKELTPVVINFLLSDYLVKLETLFTKKRRNPFGRDTLNANSVNQVDTEKSAKYCTKFVSILIEKLDDMGQYCSNLIEESDGVLDALGMFKEGSADVKRCHTLLLQCTLALISWPGFQSQHNKDMKKDLLKKLCRRGGSPTTDHVNQAFTQFAGRAKSVLHLPGAVALLKLIQKILLFGPPVSARKMKVVHDLSHDFLTRGWTDLRGVAEAGAAPNAHVEAVFATYVATLAPGDRILQVTDMIARVEKEALKLTKKEDCMASFVIINKSNFYIVYKTLCASLTEVARLAQTLPEWTAVVEALGSMTEIVQHLQTPQNLKEYARVSTAFYTVFLNKAMDLLNKNIMSKPEEVQHVLKTFQTNSRIVNRWIYDVRAKKNSNLIAYTPTLRKLMERIIMRVKAILLPFPESFSVGILKTRNMAGQEILSQQVEDSDDEAEQGDEENEDDITVISDDDRDKGSDGEVDGLDLTPAWLDPIFRDAESQSDLFQEDLYPPTACDQAALSAAEWSNGANVDPLLVSLHYSGAGHPPAARTAAPLLKLPNVLNRMRSSSANIARSSSSSDDDATLPASHRLRVQGKPVPRTRSISGGYVEDQRSGEIRSPRVLRRGKSDSMEDVQPSAPGEAPHARRLHAPLKTWPKCQACDETIDDEEFTCAEERVYHVRHFSCCKCDKPLAGNDYYLVVDTDLPMCVGCYQSTFVAVTATV